MSVEGFLQVHMNTNMMSDVRVGIAYRRHLQPQTIFPFLDPTHFLTRNKSCQCHFRLFKTLHDDEGHNFL